MKIITKTSHMVDNLSIIEKFIYIKIKIIIKFYFIFKYLYNSKIIKILIYFKHEIQYFLSFNWSSKNNRY